ncbi:MAG TPA: cellulase family glycosylhydrolase, partial [Solirubrobacteraceae bacterium]|nr:cellulase family glycosylhydrolase [Solirubrobacteraceae bacterium]
VGDLRARLLDAVPVELRHRAVAAYTLLLPETGGTADLVPLAHVGDNPYAINVVLEPEVEEWKIRRSLDMIAEAGFGWIKQQVVWAEIESPAKGQFVNQATGGDSWRKYDRIVELAAERDLRVIMRVDTSPVWARPGNPKLETPPENAWDYAEFLGKLARRYRGRVDHFQIWNEPNLPFEWGDRAPDPREYLLLLRAAHGAIKLANPDAVVISAAMAPTTELSEKGINELVFLQRLYDEGARGYFDVLGANAYGLRSGPDDRRVALDRDVNFSRPILVRRLMVRNGDAGRPIWASEVGWNAAPHEHPGARIFGVVDRELQARYSARAYERAQAEWPWMGVMSLWHFRLVAPEGPRLPQYFFNAVRDDFTPEPLYEAMKERTRQPHPLERGFRQEDDWRIEWRGGWRRQDDPRAVLRGYAESSTADAGFALPFRGADLEMVVARAPDGGQLRVQVDGGAPVLVEGGGREEWGARVPIATGLADGWHVLEAAVVDGRPVRVDGFVVDRRTLSPGWVGGLLLGSGLAALGAAVVASRRRAAP